MIQEFGGWKSLAMIRRYAHLSQAHKRQAVELFAVIFPSVFPAIAPEAELSVIVSSNVVSMMGR